MYHAEDDKQNQAISSVYNAILQIKKAKMVIMVDDQSRENEGDLVLAAEDVTAESINFMAKEARGLICLPMDRTMIDRLQLPMMSDHSKTEELRKTAFTVSIEAKKGVSTGISAADRATTIKLAIDDNTEPSDLVVPGHVFPLKSRSGGVLERAGHTEGSVDLVKLAGKKPASVICEIMNSDGTMARMKDLQKFSKNHNIPIVSIEDLINYRMLYDDQIKLIHSQSINNSYGIFQAKWFQNQIDKSIHVALIKGTPSADLVTEVRVYKQRLLEDVFGMPSDQKCTIKRVDLGMKMLSQSQTGVYLYLSSKKNSEFNNLKNQKTDNSKDFKMYGIGAQILRKLSVGKLIINTLTPKKLVAIGGFGLEIVGIRVLDQAGETKKLIKRTKLEKNVGNNYDKLQNDHIKKQASAIENFAISNKTITDTDNNSTNIQTIHSKKQFLIIRTSMWHTKIVDNLCNEAIKTLKNNYKNNANLDYHHKDLYDIWQVPGCYEIISSCARACDLNNYKVILCFGCVVKGETSHDRLVSEGLNTALVNLQINYKIPIIHGVLSVENIHQAQKRSDPNGSFNRGKEAGLSAIQMAKLIKNW